MKILQMVDNVVTASIMLVIVLLLALGLSFTLHGSLLGMIPVAIALAMVKYGWTELGYVKDEKTGDPVKLTGFLLFFGSPIMFGEKCVTVNCSVILFPLFGMITAISVNMTPKTIDRTVSILSREPSGARIQRPMKVTVTIKPNQDNPSDFITYGNGKYDKIIEDINGIITVKTELIAQNESIFGVTLVQVQAECTVPVPVAEAAEEVLKADLETKARIITAQGLDEVTNKIMADAVASGSPIDYKTARKYADTATLFEQEKVERRQFEVLAPDGTTLNLFMGEVSHGAQTGQR